MEFAARFTLPANLKPRHFPMMSRWFRAAQNCCSKMARRRSDDAGGREARQRARFEATVFARLEALTICTSKGASSHTEVVALAPVGVDMNRVVQAGAVVDEVCAHRIDVKNGAVGACGCRTSTARLDRAICVDGRCGSCGSRVIFGAVELVSLLLIAASATAGACLRRALASKSHNPFIQPTLRCAAGGGSGSTRSSARFERGGKPCCCLSRMVLVPGPHVLNGTLDLARGRVGLGVSRIVYATMIVLMICAGTIDRLWLGGCHSASPAASAPVPFVYDLIAAGIAVAAYGSFFAMPWRMMPIP